MISSWISTPWKRQGAAVIKSSPERGGGAVRAGIEPAQPRVSTTRSTELSYLTGGARAATRVGSERTFETAHATPEGPRIRKGVPCSVISSVHRARLRAGPTRSLPAASDTQTDAGEDERVDGQPELTVGRRKIESPRCADPAPADVSPARRAATVSPEPKSVAVTMMGPYSIPNRLSR